MLLAAIGCGGSDAPPPNQGGRDNVVITLPDGGTAEVPAPPPPVGNGAEAQDGIFVSASKGAAGADGAKARPVKTIAEAIALAAQKHLPVNVCAETYAEAVTLVDGVTLFGYFDCSNPEKWVRVDAKAKIASPTSPAVVGEGLLLPATFAGFEVEAPDIQGSAATGPAASSYGMILRSSRNLTLSELTIRAGKGQDGVDGVEPAEGNVELSKRPNGVESFPPVPQACYPKLPSNVLVCNFDGSGAFAPGAAGGTSQCKVGPNGGPGGQGGGGRISVNGVLRSGNLQDANGRALEANDPLTAKGGVASSVVGSIQGKGNDGAPGPDGTTGANGRWSFTDSGFVVGDGTAGTNGAPGQGGGGGAGAYGYGTISGGGIEIPIGPPDNGMWRSAAGAGGGAGGCGGIAGTPGSGGGASIGLFVIDSRDITLANARIEGKKGGRAGRGAKGSDGTPGGSGGAQSPAAAEGGPAGSPGGKGGKGGHAGLSGNGAPGPSIALVFKGDRPFTKDGVVLVPGTGGDGVDQTSAGTQTLPAVYGEAKQEHSF